jgi:hypothetical protein
VCPATRCISIGTILLVLASSSPGFAQEGEAAPTTDPQVQLQYTVSTVVRGRSPPKGGFIQMKLTNEKPPYRVHMSAKVKVGSMLVLNGDNSQALVSDGVIEKDIDIPRNKLALPVQYLTPSGDVSEFLVVLEIIEAKPRVRPAKIEPKKEEIKPEEEEKKKLVKKKPRPPPPPPKPSHKLAFEKHRGFFGVEVASTYLLSNSNPQKTASLIMGGPHLYWTPHINHGIDIRYKRKFMGSGEAANLEPTSIEGRYYFRIHFDSFLGVGMIKGIEIAPAIGYESYTNNQSVNYFRKGYSPMKFGLKLEFLLWEYWSTGGEVLMGKASVDTKTEIAGWLQYAIWYPVSVGGGYHLHLVETTDPTALNTREGYGDLFFFMRYNF